MFAFQRPLLSHLARQPHGHWSLAQSYGTQPGTGGPGAVGGGPAGGGAATATSGASTARATATTAAYRMRLIDIGPR
ncbi:hypothetical protein [Streptomyces liliifuscus]|uniref:hypothetical protein n=1 Tax=Streptomyces liliifuscus TaxID=2797636 RepID=UPI001F31A527